MLIENGIADAVQFFHVDALSSLVGLRVDFDLQLTLMASSLYRLMAVQVGGIYGQAEAKTIFGDLLNVSGTVAVKSDQVEVTLNRRAHNPYLKATRLADEPTRMPWFARTE